MVTANDEVDVASETVDCERVTCAEVSDVAAAAFELAAAAVVLSSKPAAASEARDADCVVELTFC